MSHRIKLPHRLVQLGDVFQTREGPLAVVAIDRGGRGREAYCIVSAKFEPHLFALELDLETLASLHGSEPEAEPEPLTARPAAE